MVHDQKRGKDNQPKYRTKAKARENGSVTEIPNQLAIPTHRDYQYSLSFFEAGNAYLKQIEKSAMDNLTFDNGTLQFSTPRLREVTAIELQDFQTNETINDIDLAQLRLYYSILFDAFEKANYKNIPDSISVSIPALVGRNNVAETDVCRIINRAKGFHNVTGVIKCVVNGRERKSIYQVLNFESYDAKTNTITFSSPYLRYVLKSVYEASIRRYTNSYKGHKKGEIQRDINGNVKLIPSHSFLISSSISHERNKVAVENVIILVGLIEMAGKNNVPNIKASTIIERNIQLKNKLEDDPQHRATILRRCFKRTFELLIKKTKLSDVYSDLRVSTRKDVPGKLLKDLTASDIKELIPTSKTLNSLVYYFPNGGKGKEIS